MGGDMTLHVSRRSLLEMGLATGFGLAACAPAWAIAAEAGLSLELVGRARAALAAHRDQLQYADRIGIVDFASPSRAARFHVLDLADGRAVSHLVAHGRGSDPAHTGWVTRLSNEPGSFASSAGAYVTRDLYVGAHGRSMRLAGLDPANSNAESRALVIHAAWYVSPQAARATGMIGRSEGCFAVSSDSLGPVLAQLGPGRMIYAGQFGAGARGRAIGGA